MTTILGVIPLLLLAANVYALEVFLVPQITGAQRPTIRVQTNLPEDTKVTIAVYRDDSDYSEQVQTKVVAGTFEGGPFPHQGSALAPGTYTVAIAVEMAQFQSLPVQSVIGPRGEELQGALVQKGMLGRRVFYSSKFGIF
jgi:hypothetical protein